MTEEIRAAEAVSAQIQENKVSEALKAINVLLEEYLKKEEEKDKLAVQVTALNKEIAVIEGRITAFLKEAEMSEYKCDYGAVKISEKWTIKMPENEVAKKELFDHLKERGIFEAYATVNYNSLNSLFKKDWEAAKARGDMAFSMPGIGPPKAFETVSIKPKKG